MQTHLIDRTSCAALVITCSDFRFKSAERAFAEQCGLTDDYDLIARPGSIRSLVAPKSEAAHATFEQEIRLLHSLHGFTRALLINHLSCRAYDDIATPENERDVHSKHLRAALTEVTSLLPGMAVELHLAEPWVDGIRITRIEP